MKARILPFGLAVLLAASATAHSQTVDYIDGGDAGYNAFMLSPLFAHSFPTEPLRRGLKTLKIVPAFMLFELEQTRFDGTPEGADVIGYALGASYIRGWSDHWGFGLLGAFQRNTGDAVGLVELSKTVTPGNVNIDPSDIVKTHRGDLTGYSFLVAGGLIFDPFSDPDGFRLPFFAGLAIGSAKSEVDSTEFLPIGGGANYFHRTETSFTSAGFAMGASAQIPFGKFRFIPSFFFTSFFGDNSTTFESAVVGDPQPRTETRLNAVDAFGAGIEVVYKPKDLSFTFVLNADDVAPKAFTLKFSKRFK